MKKILLFAVCLQLATYGLLLPSCGGSSTTPAAEEPSADTDPPAVSTVTKYNAGSNTALTSTAGDRYSRTAANSVLTVTFDEAIDDTTITDTNVTLVCNNGSDLAQTVTTSVSVDKTVVTITPSTELPSYATCTLTLGTGIKDAAANALAAAATYQFYTSCPKDDDFSLDTLGFTATDDATGNCWLYDGATYSRSTWFTAVNGNLNYATDEAIDFGGADTHGIYKLFNANSFVATIEIIEAVSATTFCWLSAVDDSGSGNAVNLLYETATGRCNLQLETGGNPPSGNTYECVTGGFNPATAPIYMQLTYTGTAVSAQVGNSADAITQSMVSEQTFDLGDSYKVGIYCQSNTAGEEYDIGDFTVDATPLDPSGQE